MVTRGILLVALLATACGQDDPCARHPGGRFALSRMVLSTETHPPVERGTACSTCHPYVTIHRENCTGFAFIDVAAIRAQVDAEGEEACAHCHGTPESRP